VGAVEMADWHTVRYDPDYPEKLDEEIVPLCDAMNAIGFVTNSSCSGHGVDWPSVWFTHEDDTVVEHLARRIMVSEIDSKRAHSTVFSKHIVAEGYNWNLKIILNDVYGDTPRSEGLKKAINAIDWVTLSIEEV